MKSHKKLYWILAFSCIFLMLLLAKPISSCFDWQTLTTDSGFDSDWDSGSSSDWGSDWGSDFGSDWGGSSGGSFIFGGIAKFVFLIFAIFIWLFIQTSIARTTFKDLINAKNWIMKAGIWMKTLFLLFGTFLLSSILAIAFWEPCAAILLAVSSLIFYRFFVFAPLGVIFDNEMDKIYVYIKTACIVLLTILILIFGEEMVTLMILLVILEIFLFPFALLIVHTCAKRKGATKAMFIKEEPVDFPVSNKNHDQSSVIDRTDLSKEILAKYGISDKEAFKKKIYDTYVAIQIAWMNNSIEDVRSVLSDTLFNMYKTQLLTLEQKNEQNVMSDFSYVAAYINYANKEGNAITIKVTLEVLCRDYLINKKTQKVVRGNKKILNDYVYELTFTKNNSTDIVNCPNCTAKLESGKSVKCSYCGSIIIRNSDELVMTRKKMIMQTKR